MKKILLVLLLLPCFSIAQELKFPIDSASQKIAYTDVVSQSGSKDKLFNKALDWFATTFRSANDVIQLKDRETGKIVGKWNILPSDKRMGYVSCTVIIVAKDDKYKYVFTDLVYLGTSEFKSWPLESSPGGWSVNMMKYAQNDIKKATDKQIRAAVDDLIKSMQKKAVDDF